MRPHLLELEAFGAFPGHVRLDLDALGQAGLVLLCGDTGGGKTTLLDALCFALYGRVPGERHKAREDLRSHHAGPSAQAWVRLEFTARGRRLRVARTPAQTRPKRRGQGVVQQPPTALLQSWEGQGWEPLAQRPEDVSAEVERFLGMDATQFFQVVVLPQGRFADFLQADHQQREKLLKQLFHVDRFEHAERWLADRSVRCTALVEQAVTELSRVAARVSQESGQEPPDDLDTALTWARDVADTALRERDNVSRTADDLLAELRCARQELAAAEQTAGRQTARRVAEEELALLLADAPGLARLGQERDAAERARPVGRALLEVDRWSVREATAAQAVAAAMRVLNGLGETPDPAEGEEQLRARGSAGRTELGRLGALLDVQRRAQQARGDAAAAAEAVGTLADGLDVVRRRREALPGRREEVEARVAEAEAAAAVHPGMRQALADAVDQQELRLKLDGLEAGLPGLAVAVAGAAAALQAAEDEVRQARVARFDAAIASLADALQPDTPCPVCGSLSHPDVSELAVGAPDPLAERQAERVLTRRRQELRSAEASQVQAQERSEGLRDQVGPVVDVDALRRAVDAAQRTAAGLAPARAEQKELAQEDAACASEGAALHAQEGAQRSRSRDSETLALELETRLEGELRGAPDVATLLRHVELLAEAFEHAAAATAAEREARGQRAQAADVAGGLAAAAGFLSADVAAAAARDDAWARTAGARLDEHRDRLAGVRARLAGAELAVDLSLDPELDRRRAAGEAASRRHEQAVGLAARAHARAGGLAALVDPLAAAVAAVAPLRQEAAEVRALAELAAGRGANRLSMTLSTFVLAARLEQVAEAASVRLTRMSGGRYTLGHTDVGRDGRRRAGLGLEVEDGWTGRRRDTATLSGGETFMAALSLALGLADVVTGEAGGQSIDALFVDEGFGTLDAASLDQVMDVLDELRANGRLVGVVSHVADLRQRIPTQIRVVKGSAGSRVETV